MRFLIFLLFLLPLAGASKDDESIRRLIQSYIDVRNHMDEAVLRGLLIPDADQLVSTGQWRRGMDDLLKGAVASSRKENGRSSLKLESVRMLTPDTAIADGNYETSTAADVTPRKMWSTFVLLRTGQGWRIAAIRNMLPAPAAP